MKLTLTLASASLGALLWTSAFTHGAAPTDPADATPAQPAPTVTTPAPSKSVGQLGPLSNGIPEILQMLDAGVSKEVVEEFITSSPIAYELKAADVIALKERGASDSITLALLKHGTKLREERAQAFAKEAAAGVQAPQGGSMGRGFGYHGLDPESYQYFQYYYLYPRTLASVYQRLGGYGVPYPFGLYRPLPRAPLP